MNGLPFWPTSMCKNKDLGTHLFGQVGGAQLLGGSCGQLLEAGNENGSVSMGFYSNDFEYQWVFIRKKAIFGTVFFRGNSLLLETSRIGCWSCRWRWRWRWWGWGWGWWGWWGWGGWGWWSWSQTEPVFSDRGSYTLGPCLRTPPSQWKQPWWLKCMAFRSVSLSPTPQWLPGCALALCAEIFATLIESYWSYLATLANAFEHYVYYVWWLCNASHLPCTSSIVTTSLPSPRPELSTLHPARLEEPGKSVEATLRGNVPIRDIYAPWNV